MRRTAITLTLIAAVAVLVALASMGPLTTTANAYETWSTSRGAGNCADCHGDFRAANYVSASDGTAWNANLHDPHRNTWLGGQCNVCHSAAGRFPVLLNSSAGASGLPGIGCNGCHDGAGTRNHHRSAGETVCNSCHGATEPVGRESANPPYYGNALGQIPGNSCNTAAAPRNENKLGLFGLDNDGDGLYDANDPDCGPAAASAITLNPASLNFGTVTAGGSAALTTQIVNSGTAALTISAIARGTGTSTEFTFSPAAPITVAAGASATLTVTYTPTGAGADTGSIVLTSNVATSPTALSVTGTGNVPPPTQPAISLNPTSLSFGTVNVGSSATLTTTMSNTGNAALNISAIARATGTSTEFTFSPSGVVTVPAGGSTTLSVTYTPTASGADTGSIVITSNASTSPTSLTVTGTGNVPPPAQPRISLNPASLSFGSVNTGSTATLTTQIQNQGTATLQVTAVNLCVGTSAEFGTAATVPFTVPSGQSASLSVTYAPTNVGTDTGCLQIVSNDPAAATVTLNLTGTGVVPPPAESKINLNPPAINFGTVNLGGSQTMTTRIENLGGSDLNITAITPCAGTSNEFSFSAPSVPFTVASGASASVSVTYAPLAAGADTGCLQIASNDPASATVSLALSGTGATPPPAGAADLDIEHFRATLALNTCTVALRLEVENESSVNGSGTATLVGVQNGTEVYKKTITVSVRSRGDARFSFPSFTPTRTGTISWTVTIADQNSDVDVAKATTTVTCSRSGADGRERDEHDDAHDD